MAARRRVAPCGWWLRGVTLALAVVACVTRASASVAPWCTVTGTTLTKCDVPVGVTDIYVTGEGIRSIAANAFVSAGASGVTDVKLSSNDLQSIPSGLLDPLTALEEVRLDRNPGLGSLPSGLFQNKPALSMVDLYDCGLTTLEDGLLANSATAATVRLDIRVWNNQLTRLPRLFEAGRAARSVYASRVFADHNPVAVVDPGFLSAFHTVIALSFAGVTPAQGATVSIPPDMLQGKHMLQLAMDGNKAVGATGIPDQWLLNVTGLESVTLQSMGLRALPADLFRTANISALTQLYLGDNDLWGVPPAAIDPVLALGTQVELGMLPNPWACSAPVEVHVPTQLSNTSFCYVCTTTSGQPAPQNDTCSYCAATEAPTTPPATMVGWDPSTGCSLCPAYEQGAGGVACSVCPINTVGAADQPGVCTPCEALWVTGQDGTPATGPGAVCTPCLSGTIPALDGDGLPICQPCPFGTRQFFTTCGPCPTGMRPNRASGATDCDECPNCVGTDGCVPGYTGLLCDTCAPDHYLLFGECHACATTAWFLPMVAGGVAFALIAALALAGYITNDGMMLVRGLATFVQLFGLQVSIGIPWPPVATQAFHWIQGVFGEFALFAPECAVKLTPADRAEIIGEVLLFGVLVLFTTYHVLGCVARRARRQHRAKKPKRSSGAWGDVELADLAPPTSPATGQGGLLQHSSTSAHGVGAGNGARSARAKSGSTRAASGSSGAALPSSRPRASMLSTKATTVFKLRTRIVQVSISFALLMYMPLLRLLQTLAGCETLADVTGDRRTRWIGDTTVECYWDDGAMWVAGLIVGISGLVILVMPGCCCVSLCVMQRRGTLLTGRSGVAMASLYDNYRPGFPFMTPVLLLVKCLAVIGGSFITNDFGDNPALWQYMVASGSNTAVLLAYAITLTAARPFRNVELDLFCTRMADAFNKLGITSSWLAALAAALNLAEVATSGDRQSVNSGVAIGQLIASVVAAGVSVLHMVLVVQGGLASAEAKRLKFAARAADTDRKKNARSSLRLSRTARGAAKRSAGHGDLTIATADGVVGSDSDDELDGGVDLTAQPAQVRAAALSVRRSDAQRTLVALRNQHSAVKGDLKSRRGSVTSTTAEYKEVTGEIQALETALDPRKSMRVVAAAQAKAGGRAQKAASAWATIMSKASRDATLCDASLYGPADVTPATVAAGASGGGRLSLRSKPGPPPKMTPLPSQVLARAREAGAGYIQELDRLSHEALWEDHLSMVHLALLAARSDVAKLDDAPGEAEWTVTAESLCQAAISQATAAVKSALSGRRMPKTHAVPPPPPPATSNAGAGAGAGAGAVPTPSRDALAVLAALPEVRQAADVIDSHLRKARQLGHRRGGMAAVLDARQELRRVLWAAAMPAPVHA